MTQSRVTLTTPHPKGIIEMDIFQELLLATTPITKIRVTGVKSTTCIRGAKRTVLVCADNVLRVIHYRGSLAAAVPTGHISVMDITDILNAA